jgi:hypothetical protein
MVTMKDPILRAGSTGTAPITPAPKSRAHDRDARRAMWDAKPSEKSSYGDPTESFAQRKHREVWEN